MIKKLVVISVIIFVSLFCVIVPMLRVASGGKDAAPNRAKPAAEHKSQGAPSAKLKAEAANYEADFAEALRKKAFYSVDYSHTTEIRVDPIMWSLLDYNTKKNIINKGIVISQARHSVMACKVLSSKSDEVLAETGWLGDIKIHK